MADDDKHDGEGSANFEIVKVFVQKILGLKGNWTSLDGGNEQFKFDGSDKTLTWHPSKPKTVMLNHVTSVASYEIKSFEIDVVAKTPQNATCSNIETAEASDTDKSLNDEVDSNLDCSTHQDLSYENKSLEPEQSISKVNEETMALESRVTLGKPQSQSHAEEQSASTGIQEFVLKKHHRDIRRLNDFIKKEWPVPSRISGSTIKLENFCCPFVSTTVNSTVFVISIGLNSVFTRNTYSADPNDPWLIYMQNPNENPELAKFISEQWEKMKLQGSCEGIDLIAKHIVYDASDVNSPPQLVSLECDNQAYVRARLPHSNITIWSHPPRDQALRASIRGHLEEGKRKCQQKLGNVEKCAKDMEKQTCSTQDWEKARRKTRDAFNKYYEDFRNILGPEELPFSFQLPTIQLKYGEQRYGNLSSGVYKANDNEAHNVFTVSGVVPRNSKKDVYDSTIGKILKPKGITFEQLMTDDVENEADGKYQE